jgi:hypothetical protein
MLRTHHPIKKIKKKELTPSIDIIIMATKWKGKIMYS